MRIALALLPLLSLAACDSGGPTTPDPDPAAALVGTWELASSETAFEVTSQVAQSVPDLQAEATGGVEVSGAVTGRLPFAFDPFWFVYAGVRVAFDGVGFQSVPDDPDLALPPSPGPATALTLEARGDALEAFLAVRAASGEVTSYRASVAGGPRPYTRDGGRLSIPTVTLTGPGGAEATVSGSATFPEIPLAVGASTPVRTIPRPAEAASYALTLGADGAFSEDHGARGRTSGRWEVTAPGTLTVEVVDGGGLVSPGTTRYAFDVEGGRLRLRLALPPAGGCDAACLDRHAQALFAAPRSLSSVRYATESVFDPAR